MLHNVIFIKYLNKYMIQVIQFFFCIVCHSYSIELIEYLRNFQKTIACAFMRFSVNL